MIDKMSIPIAHYRNDEEKKRVSLYLPASLYDKVSMYSSLCRVNINQMINNILEENVTTEKLQKALVRMQEDVKAYMS